MISLCFKMLTSVQPVTSVTAVRRVTIQMDLTRAPVTVATRETDTPVKVRQYNYLINCAKKES